MAAAITHRTHALAGLLPFLGSSSRQRRRTGAALFVADLVPIVGVAVLGWSLGEMLPSQARAACDRRIVTTACRASARSSSSRISCSTWRSR